VKESFETLIRKILLENPSAGRGQGSGGVFGAGVEDREAEGTSSPGKVKMGKKGSKESGDKKKSKCIIL
jgi:hypothetical protein